MDKLKVFWTRRILGFEFLVDARGKRIKRDECTGCVVDYVDYANKEEQESGR